MTTTPRTVTGQAPPGQKPAVPAKAGPRRATTARRASRNGLAAKVAAIAAALALWQFIAVGPLIEPDTLPSPVEVLTALIGLSGEATYWTALGLTLRAWALGLLLCCAVGIPVGLLLGSSKAATRSTSWIIDFFRTIPTIALLPLVLLLFGTTIKMEITMIVAAAIWPMIIQSMYAAHEIEPLLKWVVRVFRISRLDRLRYLWAPSVSLMVSTGLRLSATMALLMTIAAEYIGGAPGLGSELSNMEQSFQRPEVFAYAFTAGVIGLCINMLVVFLQRHFLWWHPSIRGERSS